MSDLEHIMSLMRKYTFNDEVESELGEQDAAAGAATGGGGGAAYPTVTKWETGLTRGPANQIALSKWRDIVKLNRGKANTLL